MKHLPVCRSVFFFVLLLTLFALPVGAAPARQHTTRAETTASEAYILNSGTTKLPGYRIYVGADGRLSYAVWQHGRRIRDGRKGMLTPAVRQRFFAALTEAGNLNRLPRSRHPRYAQRDDSPGVQITVEYRGRQSPNLREAASRAGENLYQNVKQVIQVLRLPVPNVP